MDTSTVRFGSQTFTQLSFRVSEWLLLSVTLFPDYRPNVAKDSKAKQRERVRGDGPKPELGFPLERHQRIKHRPLRLELYGLPPILRGETANLPPVVKTVSSDRNCKCPRLPSGAQGPVEVLYELALLRRDGAATLGLHP